MHINPGTERAILRLSDNIPSLISALEGLRQAFEATEPDLKLFASVMTAIEEGDDQPYTSERMRNYLKEVKKRERSMSADNKT
jgi:hypothetical protein